MSGNFSGLGRASPVKVRFPVELSQILKIPPLSSEATVVEAGVHLVLDETHCDVSHLFFWHVNRDASKNFGWYCIHVVFEYHSF